MVYIEVASGVSIDSNHHGHLHQNDIDRMSRELFWEIEQQLIMHKIAKEYYGFRYVRLLDGIFKLESDSRIVYLMNYMYAFPILQIVLVSTSTTSFDDNIHYHNCIYTIQP